MDEVGHIPNNYFYQLWEQARPVIHTSTGVPLVYGTAGESTQMLWFDMSTTTTTTTMTREEVQENYGQGILEQIDQSRLAQTYGHLTYEQLERTISSIWAQEVESVFEAEQPKTPQKHLLQFITICKNSEKSKKQ